MAEILSKAKAYYKKGKQAVEKGQEIYDNSILNPGLLFSRGKRDAWLRRAIVDDMQTARISQEAGLFLLEQADEPNTDRHLRELLWCDVAVHYPGAITSLAAFAHGYNTGSTEWMVGSVAFHFLPKIGPGSIARTVYLGGRAIQERYFLKDKPPVLSGWKEVGNLGLSLLPLVGHASVVVRMYKESPETAEFFLHHGTTRDYKIPAVNRFMSGVDRFTQRMYNRLTDGKVDFSSQVPK